MGVKFKFFRFLRIAFALAVFLLISVQFLDLYHSLPRSYYANNPIQTQFAPSLLKWISTGAVVAGAGFITFCIFALIFGRVYCASFCAFGVLMDILRVPVKFVAKAKFFKNSKLAKKAKDALKMSYKRSRNLLRATFLGLAIILITCGWTTLFGLIDPYSLYGKIMGSCVHPVIAQFVNFVSEQFYNFEIYAVAPIDGNPQISIALFGFALLLLVAIAVASMLRGRLFCNTVCPVGALLGFISKFSIFQLQIDKSSCVSCGMCERNCKAECINVKEKSLDFSKCVLCLNCATSCPKSALKYGLNSKYCIQKNESNAKCTSCRADKKSADFKVSRRKLPVALASVSALLFAGAKKEANAKIQKGNVSAYGVDGERADKRLTAPPGAISIENFLENCTACQICTAACKAQILKPSTTEWGLAHFMQPYMDFSDGFCLYECHSCSKACPTGAIRFVSGKVKRTTKIGTAIFNPDLCVVKTDGTDCAACGEHCPVQAIEMLPYGKKEDCLFIPHVHADVCIGCGACESICPVRPHRAIVVQGLAEHIKAKKFEESMRIHKTVKEKPKGEVKKQDNPFPF